MKKLLFCVILTLVTMSAFAQTTMTIKGKVIDKKANQAVGEATIRIMTGKDSTYVTGSSSNDNGVFSVNVKPGNYLVGISFLGYTTVYKRVTAAAPNLGEVYLGEDSHLLKEAVVTGKAVEVQVKGDTVEYNADAYKTQPSAVVEDLIKKLPGAEVGTDGSITINGKTISKILVDGKEFFSDDPKVASKNLPASMVQKLQVLDKKSDMAQMTGFDDGNEETVLNLQVRAGMKEGLFGNAYAGGGIKNRYEGNAMINYMKNNNQYTFLGGLNNTNNAGFSDFASTMFEGNRPPRGLSFGNNNGITTSKNAGFNFSSDLKKNLTLGGNVRYGFSDNSVTSNSYTNYLSTDQNEYSSGFGKNKSQNMGANLKMDWKVDSLTRVIFTPTLQYNINDNYQTADTYMTGSVATDTINTANTLYDADGKGLELTGQLDLSRTLSASGRTVSATFKGGVTNSHSDGISNSDTKYYEDSSENEDLDQNFRQKDNSHNWSGFLSYVEPLGNNNFAQLTYQYADTKTKSDLHTDELDTLTQEYSEAPEYTRNLKTDFQTHNVSLNYKLVRKQFNLTLGVGVEPSTLNVDITSPDASLVQSVTKNEVNFAPNALFNYYWSKSKNLRAEYRSVSTQPTAAELTDGIPSGTSVVKGNADLTQSFEHRIRLRFQNFNAEQGSAMMIFSNFSYLLNDIASNVSSDSTTGYKTTSYKNVNGDFSANTRFIYNKPIFNKLLTFHNMSYVSYASTRGFINDEKNKSKTAKMQENMGLNYRSDLFDLSLNGNLTYTNINNTLSGQTGQSTYDYGGDASATVYLPANFSFDSDVTYSTNAGYSNNYKLNQWVWNMSFSKQVFKDKSGTIRIKVYDILNQKNNISRTSSSTSVEDTFTNSLSRYVMVHFVYKFQMFKGGMKKSDMDFRRFGPGPGGPGPRG